MILLIKHTVDWWLIPQWKQTQINKDNIRENSKIVEHGYKVGDKVIIVDNFEYNYETPYKGPLLKTHCCKNGTVVLQCGEIEIRQNIRCIKPYTSDKNVKGIKC